MIAALLLTLAAAPGQDLLEEARRLQGQGRYVEALEVLEQVEDRAGAGLQRALCLWTAGDLGGALLAALEGLEAGGDEATRRQLLWRATGLALELGEAELALDLVTRWEESVAGASDLTPEEQLQWREGWGPGTGTDVARADAEDLAERLESAAGGITRARVVGALFLLLAAAGVLGLGRR